MKLLTVWINAKTSHRPKIPMPPKTVAVVGFKDSGKTQLVEALTQELSRRGLRVATVKHTGEGAPLDTPGKDTARHREAGSVATALLQEGATAIFYQRRMELWEAAQLLEGADIILVEGLKTLTTHPRVVVARNPTELEELSNGLEIAAASHQPLEGSSIPTYTLKEVGELADLVWEKAYNLLPGLNCGQCGHGSCLEMGRAILRGEEETGSCVAYGGPITLRVNGVQIPLGGFTGKALINVVLGYVKTLKGVEAPRKVEVEFEADE